MAPGVDAVVGLGGSMAGERRVGLSWVRLRLRTSVPLRFPSFHDKGWCQNSKHHPFGTTQHDRQSG